jgi:uncharacterized membrane-anchored protein YhcB (DUF1043 family)
MGIDDDDWKAPWWLIILGLVLSVIVGVFAAGLVQPSTPLMPIAPP